MPQIDTSVNPMMNLNGNNHNVPSSHKSSKGGWNAAIFIIFVEVAERFAYYGIAGNLMMYLTNFLNESMATSAKNVNLWVGVSSLFPLLGAIIADSFLGRFRTIIISTTIYLLGMIMVCFSVSIVPMNHRKALFYTSLYILAIGEGGHKPCVQTFAADQFDEYTIEERKAKSSFFNWWYLAIVFAATSAVLFIIYLQDNVSWVAGCGVMAGVLAASLALFLAGINKYRKEIPVGSPFTKFFQVFVAAARKWRVDETRSRWGVYFGDHENNRVWAPESVLEHLTLARTDQFRFLDKAMIIDNIDVSSETTNPWRLCTQTQVEEVKLVVRLLPIWLSNLMFNVVQAQLHTFFTKQGSTMVRSIGPHFQLSPASLQGIVGITILIAVPIYDRVFVPITRKFTKNPSGITVLQRIGIGMFFSILNMVVSALVEAKRVKTSAKYNLIDNPKAIVPLEVWWLFPQYLLCGLSDTFNVVGLQQLFYDQMPEGMRSFGAAAYISIVGVGNFLSSWIISLVQLISSKRGEKWLGNNLNRAHLDDFYWVLAALSGLNLFIYIWIAKGFVYKKIEGQDTTNEKESKVPIDE